MAIEWNVLGSTHGMSCAGCAEAADKAIATAKVTGSVGAMHDDNGNHVASVERKDIAEVKWFECPYDYHNFQGVQGIIAHFEEKHPRQVHLITGLSPLLLSSRLGHIDASYNGPATD